MVSATRHVEGGETVEGVAGTTLALEEGQEYILVQREVRTSDEQISAYSVLATPDQKTRGLVLLDNYADVPLIKSEHLKRMPSNPCETYTMDLEFEDDEEGTITRAIAQGFSLIGQKNEREVLQVSESSRASERSRAERSEPGERSESPRRAHAHPPIPPPRARTPTHPPQPPILKPRLLAPHQALPLSLNPTSNRKHSPHPPAADRENDDERLQPREPAADAAAAGGDRDQTACVVTHVQHEQHGHQKEGRGVRAAHCTHAPDRGGDPQPRGARGGQCHGDGAGGVRVQLQNGCAGFGGGEPGEAEVGGRGCERSSPPPPRAQPPPPSPSVRVIDHAPATPTRHPLPRYSVLENEWIQLERDRDKKRRTTFAKLDVSTLFEQPLQPEP